jgi:hypothetical protein
MPHRVSELLTSLEGTTGTSYCLENVEVASFVFNLGYLERAECMEL